MGGRGAGGKKVKLSDVIESQTYLTFIITAAKGLVSVYFVYIKIPNIMGLFYVPATPNIMDLFYVLSIMGLSYVQQIHNIMGLFLCGQTHLL